MRQIPSTLVLSALLIVFAEWPTVQGWADVTVIHHYFVHTLYLLAGGLFGLQTAWWLHQPAAVQTLEEGVSS